ncbi:MAG TPA: sulfatase-like hydrolase/transferase, partial [Victivallales bacterium]|nr:sulfatase-like hydrolase/transferase [Victivallales bacterium]
DRFTRKWLVDEKFYVDTFVGERGNEWLAKAAPKDKSWFCCISFPGPHMPYDGIGLPDNEQYKDEEIDLPLTEYSDIKTKPEMYEMMFKTGHGSGCPEPIAGMTKDEARLVRRSYYANMSLIDRKIGQIIETLKKSGEYDNTLIIYTSDHGDFMADFGMIGKGQYLAEVIMRVPFLIKPPVAGFKGRRDESFISNVDIAATCLSVAGMEKPDDMSSVDLSSHWISSNPENREFSYCEAAQMRSIRDRNWKLVHYRDREYGELYHISEDPWEKKNLWDDSACAQEKNRLSRKLVDCMMKIEPRADIRWNKRSPEW